MSMVAAEVEILDRRGSQRTEEFNAQTQRGLGPQPKGKPPAVSQKPLIVEAASAPQRGDTSQPRDATAGSAPWGNTPRGNEP